MLKIGVNAFVRDLSDFLVVNNKKADGFRIVLTDFNAILDCSNSNRYSRENIMSVVDPIIDELVSSNYKPFVSHRPTMLDLRF